DSSDFEDIQPVSEDKGVEGTFTTAVVSKKKRAGKEKLKEVIKEKEKRKRVAVSDSDRVSKKPRTQKKKEQQV
ncbi:hypothetical protein A2U01_0100033, partial [Trifolium medium]|nr:hypothetical protein [Trifolium medium]